MTKHSFTFVPELGLRNRNEVMPQQPQAIVPGTMSYMMQPPYYGPHPHYGMGMPNAQPFMLPQVRNTTIRDRGLVIDRILESQMAGIVLLYFVSQPWVEESNASEDVVNAATLWCKELLYAMRNYVVLCGDIIAPGLRISRVVWHEGGYNLIMYVCDDEGSSVVGCGVSVSHIYRPPVLGEVANTVANQVLLELTQERFFEVHYPGVTAQLPGDIVNLEETWKEKYPQVTESECDEPTHDEGCTGTFSTATIDNGVRIANGYPEHLNAPNETARTCVVRGTQNVNGRVSVGTRSKEEQSDNPDDWESVQNSKKLMAKLRAEEPQVLPDSPTQD